MMESKSKLQTKILKTIIIISIAALIFVIYLILQIKPLPEEIFGDESLIITDVKNIRIENFDTYGMGILNDDKYYQIQYGVHIKDNSFIGDKIGTTKRSNSLTNVKDDIFQYEENASYLVEDNSDFYRFKGNEDIILVNSVYNEAINGFWIMSPELLQNTSLYKFVQNPVGLKITYYPNAENLAYKYEIESPEPFLSSFRRVDSPEASKVEVGYLTIDDNSGLLYGALVYFDIETDLCYINPPSFPNLIFKANNQLKEYVDSYLTEKAKDELNRPSEMDNQ